MSDTPKPRGGARPGAGRKPAGKVTMFLNVKPETKAKIIEEARITNTTHGEVVDKKFRRHKSTARVDPGN